MDLFTTDLFAKGILPFLLVFVLVFAILQRSKIFGDGKSQIDALLSLAVALILIGFPTPRDIILNIIPWLVVALIVIFIILVIYGLSGEVDKEKGLKLPKWFNKAVMPAAVLFVVILVLTVTGGWAKIFGWFSDSSAFGNIFMILIVAIVLWVALRKDSSSAKND